MTEPQETGKARCEECGEEPVGVTMWGGMDGWSCPGCGHYNEFEDEPEIATDGGMTPDKRLEIMEIEVQAVQDVASQWDLSIGDAEDFLEEADYFAFLHGEADCAVGTATDRSRGGGQ